MSLRRRVSVTPLVDRHEIATGPSTRIVEVEPTYQFLPAGHGIADPLPGDLGFTHGHAWTSKAIRLGQDLGRRDLPAACRYWNHVFCVERDDGTTVEALGRGVVRRNVAAYFGKDYIIVRVDADDHDRAQMAAFLAAVAARKPRYGYANIASIGLNLASGCRLAFAIDGEWICSGLGADMLARAGYLLERASVHTTPADLACTCEAFGPITSQGGLLP